MEISDAMGLDLAPFHIGKYIFAHPHETQQIDQILNTL